MKNSETNFYQGNANVIYLHNIHIPSPMTGLKKMRQIIKVYFKKKEILFLLL